MDRPRRNKPPKQRRYHKIDDERFAFDEGDNPDWLVGAN